MKEDQLDPDILWIRQGMVEIFGKDKALRNHSVIPITIGISLVPVCIADKLHPVYNNYLTTRAKDFITGST